MECLLLHACCRENLNLEFSRRRLADYVKKMRAARAARSFLPFQPIISLICGVSVNVADVVT